MSANSYSFAHVMRLRKADYAKLYSTGEIVRVIREEILDIGADNYFLVERIEDGPGVVSVFPSAMLYPVNGPLDMLAMEAK